jgi:hypothetical protein
MMPDPSPTVSDTIRERSVAKTVNVASLVEPGDKKSNVKAINSTLDFCNILRTSRGENCPTSEYLPFDDVLNSRFDVFFSKQGGLRVQLWRTQA